MFIWNMLSLNGMMPFGGRPNTKTMQAWPKADNIGRNVTSFPMEVAEMEKLQPLSRWRWQRLLSSMPLSRRSLA
jgi:hypothetical protein